MNKDGRELRFGLWYDFRNPPQWRQASDRLYGETLDQIAWGENHRVFALELGPGDAPERRDLAEIAECYPSAILAGPSAHLETRAGGTYFSATTQAGLL